MAFKSTTARLLVDFAKDYFKVKNLSSQNKELKQATVFYATATQMRSEVEDSYTEIPQIKATLASMLNKLKEIGTASTNKNYETFNAQATDFNKRADENTNKHVVVLKNFDDLCTEKFDVIRTILAKTTSSKTPDEIAGDQVSQNVLVAALNALKEQENQLIKLARETSLLQQEGHGKIKQVFDSLTGTVKAQAVSLLPAQARENERRTGGFQT